jgi:hypothetical protein
MAKPQLAEFLIQIVPPSSGTIVLRAPVGVVKERVEVLAPLVSVRAVSEPCRVKVWVVAPTVKAAEGVMVVRVPERVPVPLITRLLIVFDEVAAEIPPAIVRAPAEVILLLEEKNWTSPVDEEARVIVPVVPALRVRAVAAVETDISGVVPVSWTSSARAMISAESRVMSLPAPVEVIVVVDP